VIAHQDEIVAGGRAEPRLRDFACAGAAQHEMVEDKGRIDPVARRVVEKGGVDSAPVARVVGVDEPVAPVGEPRREHGNEIVEHLAAFDLATPRMSGPCPSFIAAMTRASWLCLRA